MLIKIVGIVGLIFVLISFGIVAYFLITGGKIPDNDFFTHGMLMMIHYEVIDGGK